MDGLNLVAPADDANLIAARPADLLLATSGTAAALPLANGPSNNDWRLHPSAVELKALYDAGSLAFVHAAGTPANSRSHFQMQALAEHGIADPTLLGSTTGWIGRYAETAGLAGNTFSLVSVQPTLPPSMTGDPQALSLPTPQKFVLGSGARSTFIEAAYASAPGLVGAQGRTTIAAVQAFAQADSGFTPPPAGTYPNETFATGLSVIAELIKLNVGLQFAEVEYSVWDTHVNQKSRFDAGVKVLSPGIGAFFNDIAALAGNVTMVVMTEFGRRVQSNASLGTDHGHGGVMMVIGGRVKGGRIYGNWPGLSPSALDQGDVPVTTDARSVLAEVLSGVRSDVPAGLFPGLAATPPLGLIHA